MYFKFIFSLLGYNIDKKQKGFKMINIEKLNEKILDASEDTLRIILDTVFCDTFNYQKETLANVVFASIHTTENEGDENLLKWTNKEIWNLLK